MEIGAKIIHEVAGEDRGVQADVEAKVRDALLNGYIFFGFLLFDEFSTTIIRFSGSSFRN